MKIGVSHTPMMTYMKGSAGMRNDLPRCVPVLVSMHMYTWIMTCNSTTVDGKRNTMVICFVHLYIQKKQAINACSDLEESAVHYLNSTSIDFSTNMISPIPAEGAKEGAEIPRIGEHKHDRHIKVLMASRFGTQPSGDPEQTNSRVSCTPSSRIMSPDQVLSELRTQESAPILGDTLTYLDGVLPELIPVF